MPMKPPTFNPFPKTTAPSRASAHRRGYGRRWEKLARCYLAQHPLCVDPFGDHAGRVVPAECVDHIVPRSRGGTDDLPNLQSLCARCHSKKTCKYDGGLGRPVRDGCGQPITADRGG